MGQGASQRCVTGRTHPVFTVGHCCFRTTIS